VNVRILYTNWKDETKHRTIIPKRIFWGKTEYHPDEQWLLEAWDIEKRDDRVFAMKDIHWWDPVEFVTHAGV